MSLLERLRGVRPASAGVAPTPVQDAALPGWARRLFASPLAPRVTDPDGGPLVWAIRDDASTATITEQFKANAEDYHRRYSASDHFQVLFVQALDATGVVVTQKPLVLDLGSGSGVNSVVPCQRLFPGARIVATDLSAELLDMLARYERDQGTADEVLCVVMDAMSNHVAPGSFDLVTGASILHHLERPQEGIAAAARALKPGGHAMFFEPFNGWAIMRLAYERVLAESRTRGEPLAPEVTAALEAMSKDIAVRTTPDPASEAFKALDDKWLFSRSLIEGMAAEAGFAQVRFVPHNDHRSLYRDSVEIQLRLCLGGQEAKLPDWAIEIFESFDAALSLHAKRELMLEGTIVLTKGG